MPRSFAFNDTLGVGDIYFPRSLLHDSIKPPIEWPYTPWIKIKRGVSLASANAELGAIVRQFAIAGTTYDGYQCPDRHA